MTSPLAAIEFAPQFPASPPQFALEWHDTLHLPLGTRNAVACDAKLAWHVRWV